ncbi:hypothetical protein Cadr_000007017 [Camelus dromedarius]|uniref:Uncharacterized protein n=1 Tax=Camelus dromedarius TaxID=9838 RepID=A0A5N4E611_CAMDR|nr:hypothetical protein Cadr_000007017 [Camelus dromedarius]
MSNVPQKCWGGGDEGFTEKVTIWAPSSRQIEEGGRPRGSEGLRMRGLTPGIWTRRPYTGSSHQTRKRKFRDVPLWVLEKGGRLGGSKERGEERKREERETERGSEVSVLALPSLQGRGPILGARGRLLLSWDQEAGGGLLASGQTLHRVLITPTPQSRRAARHHPTGSRCSQVLLPPVTEQVQGQMSAGEKEWF